MNPTEYGEKFSTAVMNGYICSNRNRNRSQTGTFWCPKEI